MEACKKNWHKFTVGITLCLIVRMLPFRPPNIEPILAVQMPFAHSYGALTGFSFGILSIIFYDLFTGTLGLWSLITATAYGILGVFAGIYFKSKGGSAWEYVKFAIFGTLFFDAATGLTIGPLFFSQSFYTAFIGQIPFTLMHLLGNISFAILLSPAVQRLIIRNKKFELAYA